MRICLHGSQTFYKVQDIWVGSFTIFFIIEWNASQLLVVREVEDVGGARIWGGNVASSDM